MTSNPPAFSNTKKLVLSAFFLALGLVLPFLTGQIPEIGNMISPMHFPVMLCGFICGGLRRAGGSDTAAAALSAVSDAAAVPHRHRHGL